jgi:hypothetical protein
LLQEISRILPVDLDRLISEGPTQIDISTPSEQLIIPLKIKSTRDLSKENSDNLHYDLDIMIQNKGLTEIGMHNYTSLLDETYGYKLKGKFTAFVSSGNLFSVSPSYSVVLHMRYYAGL